MVFERPGLTSERPELTSEGSGLAFERLGQASGRPGLASEGPELASKEPYGVRMDVPIPPVFYRTLSPRVPSGAAAQKGKEMQVDKKSKEKQINRRSGREEEGSSYRKRGHKKILWLPFKNSIKTFSQRTHLCHL